MTTTTSTSSATVQIYQLYIRATPERIWAAITDPEWNGRYGYGAPGEFDLRPGGAYRSMASDAMKKAGEEMGFPTPDVVVDGQVVESDAPRKLVHTWRMLMDPGCAAENFTTLTYEITPTDNGVCKLTVTHDLTNAPLTAAMVSGDQEGSGAGGGWNWVLSDLKTLLETGQGFADPAIEG